jgi:branched-chain amino acid transport system permease protein
MAERIATTVKQRPRSASAGAQGRWRPALIAVCLLVLFLSQPLLSDYYQSLFIQGFLFAVLAISIDLLWGYAGILSFGQSAFFGIGGYAVGITFVQITSGSLAWPISLALGLGVAALVAAAIGWFAFYTRTNLPVLYIAVITLAVAVIFQQVVLSGGEFTGASSGLVGFSTTSLSNAQWYWLTGVLLLAVAVAVWIFVRSDAGRVLIAIRDNEERCRYLGIDVPRIKTALFAVAGVIAAVSGIAYVAYTENVAPSLVGFVLATNAVIWTAVGGRGTLIGPIAGAIILNVFGASLNAKYPFTWQLFLGALFIVVVVFIPQGVFPAIWDAGAKLMRYRQRRGATATPSSVSAVDRVSTDDRDGATGEYRVDGHAGATPQEPADGKVVLELEDVRKYFGSFEAVGGVSLQVRRGELVSIVGPNGAGKTTVIRCIADGRERSEGDVRVSGQPIDGLPPHRLVALGVGRKFQAANVFDSLTVAESLQLASWKGSFPSIWRKTKTVDLPQAALHVLRTTALERRLDERVRNLGHGEKQSLELAMVLTLEPTVVLLDEPTAGLTQEERYDIAGVLTQLVQRGDLCIVLIEHDFDFVKQISTRMIVLHEGKLLLDGTVGDVAGSEVVRAVYLGHGAH